MSEIKGYEKYQLMGRHLYIEPLSEGWLVKGIGTGVKDTKIGDIVHPTFFASHFETDRGRIVSEDAVALRQEITLEGLTEDMFKAQQKANEKIEADENNIKYRHNNL
jgi:hypothetical protein